MTAHSTAISLLLKQSATALVTASPACPTFLLKNLPLECAARASLRGFECALVGVKSANESTMMANLLT